jgi:hypothetical protein
MKARLSTGSKRPGATSSLPDHLIGRKALDELRARIQGAGISFAASEPDWDALRRSFQDERGLAEAASAELVHALERLWLLPFHRYDACAPLFLFFFAEFPSLEKRFHAQNDANGIILSAAFRVMTEMMLQGVALFPGEPHYIAGLLMAAIQSPVPGTRRHVLPIARLLATASEGHCGSNRHLAEDPDAIAIYEHLARRGRFEGVVASPHKYLTYVRQLEADPQFWKEWDELKTGFARLAFWDAGGIVRRSSLPEGNWRRDGLPNFKNPAERFQTIFDIFCWKWFLYGMERAEPRDKPLVQKIVYTFGPYGTALFIPGYWSFDANRDLDWKAISKLHKARGVPRQGEKLERNRAELMKQARRAQEADREAKKLKLRGDEWYRFIKKKVGLDPRTDNAQVRRLLCLRLTS